MKKIVFPILTILNLLSAFCTILSAYGGAVDPTYFNALPAIAAMTFPILIIITLIIAVTDCFFARRLLWVQCFVMVLGAGAIYDYSPIALGAKKPGNEAEKESQFSIMTFNAFHLKSYNGVIPEKESLKVILDSDADLICLQEAGYSLESVRDWKTCGDCTSLIDSIIDKYPNRITSSDGYSLLSRFNVDSVLSPKLPGNTGFIKNYRVNVKGNSLSLYNIHLESIGLNSDDKQLYRQITKGDATTNDVPKVRHMILSKLKDAFRIRANQAKAIRAILDVDRSDAIILCGDFNDITNCYAMRVIEGDNLLKDAYTESGFGPAITYRDSRFYFCIDHILYNSRLCPVKTRVVYGGASDHLPVKSWFFFKSDNRL